MTFNFLLVISKYFYINRHWNFFELIFRHLRCLNRKICSEWTNILLINQASHIYSHNWILKIVKIIIWTIILCNFTDFHRRNPIQLFLFFVILDAVLDLWHQFNETECSSWHIFVVDGNSIHIVYVYIFLGELISWYSNLFLCVFLNDKWLCRFSKSLQLMSLAIV